ncbi:MAG TPA: SDR family oxidoreductase, partial [Candidatus Dormibacteraeota bacterium]|nr:SDR family oxidoreductase [Candidatus Dormibacteraeota bacterium]
AGGAVSARPVAVVTGGSGGVGRAVLAELRTRGWDAVSWSRRDGVDAADEAEVESAAGRLARWDALVNNAAVLVPRLVAEMTADEWDETLRAGLRSAFLCSRAALRRMAPGGTIVNVSSLSGVAGAEKFPRMAAYVAAKSALAGLTEALAIEGRPLGVRVNAVSPGAIATPMLALSGAPREPALRPAEVARVIAWLASADSAPLSGANLRLDP